MEPLAQRLRPRTLDEVCGSSIYSAKIRSFAARSKAAESPI